MVGNRQRNRDLTVRLLAKLPAILMLYANRMSALLGKTRVFDDPDLNRSMPLDRRQCQLTHLGQNLVIRPVPNADKVQQRLMLR